MRLGFECPYRPVRSGRASLFCLPKKLKKAEKALTGGKKMARIAAFVSCGSFWLRVKINLPCGIQDCPPLLAG
jgi:hypothetical protein